jgi:hypothetical protein
MTVPEKAVTEKPEFVVTSRVEPIKHLSGEVNTHTKMIFDWRARGAFYWLVGPFVVISSLVIVTKQVPTLHGLDWQGKVAAVFAGLCFLGMAYLGGRMEAHLTDQCNRWRRTILRLTSHETGPLKGSDVIMEKQSVILAYLISHGLLLATFTCSIYIVSQSTVISPSNAVQPASITSPVASPTPSPKP